MFDILTIGTATHDAFLTSEGIKVLRDPKHLEKLGFPTGEAECFALGAKLEVDRPVLSVGGGAANAAITFARQGLRTAALVRLGADAAGDAVVSALKREGVNVLAIRDRNIGTACSTIILTPDGERTILVYRGASEGLSKREIPFPKLAARWTYIAPGGIAPSLMVELLKALKERKMKIAMNPSREYLSLGETRIKELFRLLDMVILNREEAALVTGVPHKNEIGIFRKLDQLVPGIAVMTDGARGAKVSDGSHIYTAGVFSSGGKGRVVDRTGAGDAFGSGFVAGLIQKNDISYALRLAAANATSVVEHVGAEAGILTKKSFDAPRWKYLDLDVEPL
ncbi:MAG: PfkB family carbohydrate kinase [bacterium]|nr:PfkB family carbohydrate kinase [bacterium]